MFSIKMKFFLASILMLGVMGGVVTIDHLTAKRVEALESVALEASKVEASMLMLRRNEKDFLARKAIKYKGKFEKNMAILLKRTAKLRISAEKSELETKKIASMKVAFGVYRSSFLKVIALQEEIGLDSKSGIYGELRSAVHAAEEQIKTLKDQHLRADMLQLRRNEKDFMLRSILKYKGKFEKSMAGFLKTLAETKHSEEAKKSLSVKMKNYQDKFNLLVSKSEEKGLTSKDGLLGSMRASVHASEKVLGELDKLLNGSVKGKKEIQGEIQKSIKKLDKQMLLVDIAGVVLVLMIMTWLAYMVLSPINSLSRVILRATKDNDLSLRVPIKSNDEIGKAGQAFNVMLERFQSIISEVRGSANEIIQTSEELSAVTQEATVGSQEQQTQTSLVATAMTELTSSAGEIARSAGVAATAASEAKTEANGGATIVDEAAQTINALSDGINEAADAIKKVEHDSEQIGTVLTVIRGIAEQTNLLALNASIEAARAGEQGKGFAVVADEVKTLAGRTQVATQEIQEVIENLQGGSKNAVEQMDNSQQQTKAGVDHTTKAGAAIAEVVRSVDKIDDMNSQIAAASEEQSAVLEEINRNIESISSIAEDSSKRSEGTVKSSSDLSELAGRLHELIGQFKV